MCCVDRLLGGWGTVLEPYFGILRGSVGAKSEGTLRLSPTPSHCESGILVHRTSDDTSLGGADEVQDQLALIAVGDLLLDSLEGLGIVQTTLVEGTIDVVDTEDLLIGEASTTKTDDVDPTIDNRVTTDERIGRDILVYTRTSLEHDMLRDAYELVDERASTKDRIVIDLDLSRHLSSVTEDHVISEDTVMGDMRVGHQ